MTSPPTVHWTAIPPLSRQQHQHEEGPVGFDDKGKASLSRVQRAYYVKEANKASLLFFPLGLVFQDLLR